MKSTSLLKSLFQKFITRDKLPYILIVILFLLTFFNSQIRPGQIVPPPAAPTPSPRPSFGTIPAVTPASPSARLEVISFTPAANSKPYIVGSKTAIAISFNQPLTNAQINSITASSRPQMLFSTVAHINRRTIYLRPATDWKNNVLYTINVKSSSFAPFTFSFTPSDKIDTTHVLDGIEYLN